MSKRQPSEGRKLTLLYGYGYGFGDQMVVFLLAPVQLATPELGWYVINCIY